MVEPEALLAGASGERASELWAAYAEDLADALARVRERAAELARETGGGGSDPLALLDAGPERRAGEGGPEASQRAAERLRLRAEACRALAALDEAAAELLPRLVEADRRRF